MDTYSEQQVLDLEAREEYEREFGQRDEAERQEAIASMERTGYSDRCELELAIASGFDPWAGQSIDEFFRSEIDAALNLDIPTLEEIGL